MVNTDSLTDIINRYRVSDSGQAILAKLDPLFFAIFIDTLTDEDPKAREKSISLFKASINELCKS